MIEREELPIGFTMELSQHPDILNTFAHMSKSQQQSVVEGARHISYREEMRSYVEQMGRGTTDSFLG